jgi:hypothetical protein
MGSGPLDRALIEAGAETIIRTEIG